jgi:uncharacterized protein YjbI with pentapeptide repeats
METSELFERYAIGQRNFNWVELNGVNLAKAALPRILLSRAKLINTNLERADLTQAHLMKANLSRSNFRNANLTEITLIKANLTAANLQQARLVNANLSRALLCQTNLTGANLERADLTGVDLTDSDLRAANLKGAILNHANLTRANLEGANLEETEWVDAVLIDTIMPDGRSSAQWAKPDLPPPPPTPTIEPEPVPEGLVPKRSLMPEVMSLPGYKQRLFDWQSGLTGEEFRRQLPWKSLLLMTTGYALIGQLLASHQAPWLFLAIVGFSSVGWAIDPALTWFAPLIGAISVWLSLWFSLWGGEATIGLFTVGIITLLVLIPSAFNFLVWGEGLRETLKRSMWLGGLALCFSSLLAVVFSWMPPLPFLYFALGLALVSIGCPVWISMGKRGFSKPQVVQVMSSLAFLGLLFGWIFGKW